MNIESSVKVSKIKKQALPLQERVSENSHDIAWAADSVELMPNIKTISSFVLQDGSKFYTASFHDSIKTLSQQDQHKKKQAFTSLVTTSTTLVKEFFPEVEGAVDGMELLVASNEAYKSWTDTKRVGVVQPSLKTAKMVLETLDILAPIIPSLNELTPHLKVAGLIVKFGDLAYQVYVE